MHGFDQDQRSATLRYDRWRETIVRGNQKIGLLFAAKIAIIGLGLLISLLWMTRGMMHGQFSAGDCVMVNAYVIQFALPMTYLAGSVFDIQRNLVALDEAAHMLGAEVGTPPGALAPDTEARLMQRLRASGIATIVATHSRAGLAHCDEGLDLEALQSS
jgi:ABC-type transport system involved in Fe-S cluster assembly fused permease/ATPase subunit